MVVCICGNVFATDRGLQQHIRRRYCRGPTPLPEHLCQYCPNENQRRFNTYGGLRQHVRRAHPIEYNTELEYHVENPIHTGTTNRWTDEELILMAKEEVKFTGRFINRHLVGIIPNHTLESIKSRRRQRDYIELCQSLRHTEPYVNRDIEDEAEGTIAVAEISEVHNASTHLEIVEEPLIEVMEPLPLDLSSKSSDRSHFDEGENSEMDVILQPLDLSLRNTPLHPRPGTEVDADAAINNRCTNAQSMDVSFADILNSTLNYEAGEFIPSGPNSTINEDARNAPVKVDPIKDFLLAWTSEQEGWDHNDTALITSLSQDEGNRELQSQRLEDWIEALYATHLQRGLENAVDRADRRPKRTKANKRTNFHQTNAQDVRRPYKKQSHRAEIYRKTQELYRKNRSELAECILNDKPPNGLVDEPAFQDLVNRYKNLFNATSPDDDEVIYNWRSSPDNLYSPITEKEVETAIKTSKSNSAGPDGLRISHVRGIGSKKLVLLFNTMLLWGLIPKRLKDCRTLMTPKSGDTTNVDNWRPITVSSVLLRLCNKIMGQRLNDLPLHHLQRGFRKIDGVLLNNLTLDTIVKECREKRQPFSLISIDLRKAFDSVSHCSIIRALKRFRIDDRIQRFIIAGYIDCRTVIQLGRKQSEPLTITRGVKQGDPLSSYIFNMVIDELICKLQEGERGIEFNGLKIACMGYADDIIIMANSTKEAQASLNIASRFFRERGLEANTAKCAATAVGIVPGKKILYTITRNIFHICGSLIPQNAQGEFWKYLGVKVDAMGVSAPYIQNVKTQLARVEKAPLKPDQKLILIKDYLIPKALHLLQNPRLTLNMLKETDKAVRISVRRILHLNRTCSDAFIHAPTRLGGLGVLSMRTLVPNVLSGRMNTLARSGDPYAQNLSVTERFGRLRNKLLSWTASTGESSAIAGRKWGEKLELSYSGNGLRQGISSKHSSSWISHPPPVWSGGDYARAIQLRGNLLPTQGIPSNPPEHRKCRGGCERTESLSHVLQRCPVTHWPRIRRHDRIADCLKKEARKKGWEVEVEPHIRTSSGLLKKPDLIFKKGNSIVVCDVAIPWEGPAALSATYEHKVATYSDEAFVTALAVKNPGCTINVEAVVIGARGTWCDKNNAVMGLIGLQDRCIKNIICDVINGSILVHKEFMRATHVR